MDRVLLTTSENKKYCIDCLKPISKKAFRCLQCEGRRHSKRMMNKKNPRYKGGLPNCVDCGKQLSKRTRKRCKKCADKYYVGEMHHRFGKEGMTGSLHPNYKQCNCKANGNRNYWYDYYMWKIEEKMKEKSNGSVNS